MKKEKYEERIIEEKKVKIKVIPQLHGAWAGLDNKTITLNEKTKNTLLKSELDSVLYHERGHFTFWNNLIKYAPVVITLLAITYFYFKYQILIREFILFKFPFIVSVGILATFALVLLIIGTIIELPIAWITEIMSDWYAVKRTKENIFRNTLKKFYRYNKENSKPSLKRFYDGVVLHPPQPLRLNIIKLMERIRDKKEAPSK